MELRMWSYDIAREQSPDRDALARFCDLTLNSGFNAIGLYLEHRFAYPHAPWVAGKGAVTPEDIQWLQDRYPDLDIIPFLNTLGHFEGFLYTEAGAQYACERFAGMQADPLNAAFVELAGHLVDDAMAIFRSPIIHIGGDETGQLGAGRATRQIAEWEQAEPGIDGKGRIYGRHFGPLAQRVADAGRTPAVWGDMFYEHPDALSELPKATIIFDWQYFRTPEATAQRFRDAGFRTVLCPAIQTYSATWCHLPQSERNVRDAAQAAASRGDYGVCVATWECGLLGNYETLMPAIRGAGRIVAEATASDAPPIASPYPTGLGTPEEVATYAAVADAPAMLAEYQTLGENAEEWARLMGCELQSAGGIFGYSGHRSQLKSRLLMYGNPFLLWLRDRDDLLGEPGQRAHAICERAIAFAPNAAYRGVAEFGKLAIEFVRHTEAARQAYAAQRPGECTNQLAVCRQIIEALGRIAGATHVRIGGSQADGERCRVAREHTERVIRRVKEFGDGHLGYLPSFETIVHPKFIPHDQANWWLINAWGNE